MLRLLLEYMLCNKDPNAIGDPKIVVSHTDDYCSNRNGWAPEATASAAEAAAAVASINHVKDNTRSELYASTMCALRPEICRHTLPHEVLAGMYYSMLCVICFPVQLGMRERRLFAAGQTCTH